jgi:hypothetical protein
MLIVDVLHYEKLKKRRKLANVLKIIINNDYVK